MAQLSLPFVLENFTKELHQIIVNDVQKKGINFTFSPFSILISLVLIGSCGGTAETSFQVSKKILSPYKENDVLKDMSHTIKCIENMLLQDKDVPTGNKWIAIKNCLWTSSMLDESYRGQVMEICGKAQKYVADFEIFDFSTKKPLNIASIMNQKMENDIGSPIKDLITKSVVGPKTKSILANVVIMKPKMKFGSRKFRTKHTITSPFHILLYNSKPKQVKVQMMQLHFVNALYGKHAWKNATFSSLTLPLEGDQFNIIFLRPDRVEKNSLHILEKDIFDRSGTKSLIAQLHAECQQELMQLVNIPRFTIEYKICLNAVISKLGIINMFNEKLANFWDMTKLSSGFAINYATHLTRLNFCEDESSNDKEKIDITDEQNYVAFDFLLDRSFIYLVYHISTNSICTIGQVYEPK